MGNEIEAVIQEYSGWHSESAAGTAADSCRLFAAAYIQLEASPRYLPVGNIISFQNVVLSWPGCVLAATVGAFPLMYRNARAAFEQVDVNYIYAGRTLGLSEWTIFRRLLFR